MRYKKKKCLNKKIKIISILFLYFCFILNNIEEKEKFIISSKFPKISVFLPIYNKEQYLIRSIGSLQRQTLKNIEIVAVNDGSTDNTLKLLKKLSKKDFRIKIINNDRNHGLLYSRAIGIINSNGEYLMNLDPDDRLESKNNLKLLFNKAKKYDLDYIMFLLKRIPRNRLEIERCTLHNNLQLQREDFIITNKIIKKEIFLKAYNYINTIIYKNKWNYHEDNIWNILVRKFSKRSQIINKYIYIYKRNNESLNLNKNNSLEIKNRIYRLKTLIKINENNTKNNSYENYYNYYQYYISTINSINSSILKDNEIKKKLIDLSIVFINIFKNDKEILNNINKNIINKISNKKIILFFNSFNKSIIDYLLYFSIFKLLRDKYIRKIISVDVNDIKQTNNILNFIYSNDILLGLSDIMLHENFIKIINYFNENKIIILYNNLHTSKSNHIFSNFYNFSIYSFNQISSVSINKIFFIPVNIINFANYFNYNKINNKIYNNLTVILDNYNNEYIEIIKNISSKYFQNLFFFNVSTILNSYIIEIIKKSKIILTDNFNIMELSLFFFTSCILYGNFSQYNNQFLFNVNYIKYLNHINKLEKEIINLNKNYNNKYMKMNFKKLELIIN